MNLPSLKTWIGTVYWQQALLGGPALLAVLALSLSWEPHVAVVTTASAFTIPSVRPMRCPAGAGGR